MFNKSCNSFGLDRTDEFLRMAGKLYDPTSTRDPYGDDNAEPEEDLDEEMLDC